MRKVVLVASNRMREVIDSFYELCNQLRIAKGEKRSCQYSAKEDTGLRVLNLLLSLITLRLSTIALLLPINEKTDRGRLHILNFNISLSSISSESSRLRVALLYLHSRSQASSKRSPYLYSVDSISFLLLQFLPLPAVGPDLE